MRDAVAEQEYIDGRFVDRHVGEYAHGRAQGLVAAILLERERSMRFRTFIAVTVRVRPDCYRVPDVCVKALPHEITAVLVCPDLAIEVVSPGDEVQEMLTKIGDYLAAGIPHIWVIDPYKRTVVEADQSGIRRDTSLKLSNPLVGEIDFAALFDQLDEPAD